ncbi:MAG TPA: oligosaccharide flippase family protein [Rhodopila sp.]|uniref:oligosaccharide flippase family protein n=1 Tax=Rhodopila sp. TaxID=2480087 RepID=UPI002BE7492E|nr:oligosaccharide flippase family protein [Rhodopila sp.]HVY14427.1 oligosaccharide flippase family protein [Rhodopila sp.]
MAIRFPSISPVAWLTIERVTQQGLWLILFAILAPILGPRPYGLFSIVMVFVGFCEWILLEGAAEALVTVKDLESDHINTSNLVSIGISLAFAALMGVSAPWLGDAFHDNEMKWVIWVLLPMPLLSSLSAPPIAVLRRSMEYKALAIRSVLGLTIGGVFGIILGLLGFGVWALVLQVLTQRLAELTVAWIAVSVRFGCRWSVRHFHDLRPVAVNVLMARMASLVTGQFPRIVLGYVLGPTDVGLFSLANRLVDVIVHTNVIPRTEVGRIELRSDEPGTPEFERHFLKVLQNASILSFPCFLGAAAIVPDLFELWLDHRWQPGIVPTQLMLLTGLPLAIFYSLDAALLAANQSSVFRKIAHWQAVTLAVTVVCAAPFGLTMTCLALAIRPWVVMPVFLVMFGRACRISPFAVALPPLQSLAGAGLMAVFLRLPVFHPNWLGRAPDMLLLIAIGLMFYGTYLYLFARRQLRDFIADVVGHRAR